MEFSSVASDPHFVVARGLGLNTLRVKGYSGVDLDIAQGSAHALCGEHKCGKEELLLTLAGRMHRSEGSLRVGGIDANTLRGVDRVRKIAGLGFFEHVNDVERVLRVSTVTSAELSLAGKPSRRAATDAYLERWGLLDVRSATIEELPAYLYDRLGIALGMAGDPQVLVVSDIERDLTDHESHKLADELCGLAHTTGTTVVCGVTDFDLAACFDGATCLTEDACRQRDAFYRKHDRRRVA